MKTADELKELKGEAETGSRKLHELTEEELEQVSGGGETPSYTTRESPAGRTSD